MSATDWVLLVVGALGFLAIGSFTCVIIDRLPVELDEPNKMGDHWDTRPWREVFGGTSRCSTCGAAVRPQDNIPIVSWLVLRGRCRACDERIPGFHPVVEFAAPALFLLTVWQLGVTWLLLPALWLIPVGLAIAAIDFRTLIVPTRIIWPAFFVSVALTVLAAGLEGEWRWLLSALAGLAVLAGPLFVIWFIRPAAMGFGDVRLTVLLGWNVGFFAATPMTRAVVLAVLCLGIASLVGIVYGIVALGVRGKGAKVPFGPALIAAAYFCMLWAQPTLEPFGL